METNNNNTPVNYAGFWIRVLASVIDTLVFIPFIALNFYNVYYLKSFALMLALSITIIYKPLMEWKYGATLGKMALKLKVVNLNYQSIDLNTAILRFMPWVLHFIYSMYASIMLFKAPGFTEANTLESMRKVQEIATNTNASMLSAGIFFGFIIVLVFNDKKQGLHDILAKTYCIEK